MDFFCYTCQYIYSLRLYTSDNGKIEILTSVFVCKKMCYLKRLMMYLKKTFIIVNIVHLLNYWDAFFKIIFTKNIFGDFLLMYFI